MRIFDIIIYRDGGTIEFQVEHKGGVKHVWLDTPFRGEPRAFRIDAVIIRSGAPEVRELMDDVEEWWNLLSPDLQRRTLEALAHKGPFTNPGAEMSEAIDVSRVLYVRDYVAKIYGA